MELSVLLYIDILPCTEIFPKDQSWNPYHFLPGQNFHRLTSIESDFFLLYLHKFLLMEKQSENLEI